MTDDLMTEIAEIITDMRRHPRDGASRMTPTETADILRQFNEWRRGADVPQPDPREIGEAIDAAVELIERIEKMEAALQIAMRQNSHDMLMTGDELRQCEAALEKSK